jgi:hypothetical protein
VVQHLGCLTGDLLGRLDGHGPVAARRVYLMLHHVLKELASKRLAADQRNFAQVHGLNAPCSCRRTAVFQGVCSSRNASQTQPGISWVCSQSLAATINSSAGHAPAI